MLILVFPRIQQQKFTERQSNNIFLPQSLVTPFINIYEYEKSWKWAQKYYTK